MKTQFQRYYFLLGTLLIVVLGSLFSRASLAQTNVKDAQANFISFHFAHSNSTSELNQEEAIAESQLFHKGSVSHKITDHSKANVVDPEFEIEPTLKFQKFEALLRFVVAAFVFAAVIDFHSRKSALILSKLSHFYTSLNNALYLKFRVIRL